MGNYLGKENFLVLSNQRAVVTTLSWLDIPFMYFKWIQKII